MKVGWSRILLEKRKNSKEFSSYGIPATQMRPA